MPRRTSKKNTESETKASAGDYQEASGSNAPGANVKNENDLKAEKNFLPSFNSNIQNQRPLIELTQQAVKEENKNKKDHRLRTSQKLIEKTPKEKEIKFSDVVSISFMERFAGVEKDHSFFGGKSKKLEEALIISSQKIFRENTGKPWVIFVRGNFIFYCKTYNDYYVLNVETGKRIAEATLADDWLESISVKTEYQKKGIGTGLIEAIVKTIGNKFLIPGRGLPSQSAYYLTTEGAALITSCLRKKIIEDEQCMMDVPPASPLSSVSAASSPRRHRW